MEHNIQSDQILNRIINEISVFKKEEWRQQLISYINFLLLNDFNKLIGILYRIDVDEEKLKEELKLHPDKDAAIVISDLLIQRQKDKQESIARQSPPEANDEDERW